jgi:hypothetical protein
MNKELHVPPNKIVSAHFGNGLSVWISDIYLDIAFIHSDRSFSTCYILSKDTLECIMRLAATDNRNISITQDSKVFDIPPLKEYEYELFNTLELPSFTKYQYRLTKATYQ